MSDTTAAAPIVAPGAAAPVPPGDGPRTRSGAPLSKAGLLGRAAALLFVIGALVWLATLWRWETSRRELAVNDVVLHLLVLPLALTAAFLFMVWSIDRLRAMAGQAAPQAGVTQGAGASAGAVHASAAAERALAFAVLAVAAQTRSGSDWAAVSQATEDATPSLDAALSDELGRPVFTARVNALALAETRGSVDAAFATLAQQQPGLWERFVPSTVVLRALPLLDLSLAQLLPTFKRLRAEETGHRAAEGRQPLPTPLPAKFSVRVAVPERWSTREQELVKQWLQHKFEEWALEQDGSGAAVEIHLHPVASADDFWHITDQQMLQWHREGVAGVLVALAADSSIAAEPVTQWASARRLFTGGRAEGHLPGEGAGGLVLASERFVSRFAPEALPLLARLHRASLLRRDKSADAAGGASSSTAQSALKEALTVSGLEGAAVVAVASDADHRSSRSTEALELLQAALPQLDGSTDLLRAAVDFGEAGVARLLLITALAVTKVQAACGAVVVLGVQPQHERFCALVLPPDLATVTATAPPASAGGA